MDVNTMTISIFVFILIQSYGYRDAANLDQPDDGPVMAQNVLNQIRGKGSQKSVTVALESKWADTPLYLESSEFLAEESQEYFWSFIDLIHSKLGNDKLIHLSPKEQYNVLIELSATILNSYAKLALLKFSLSLRANSPVVAMFDQMARDKMKELNVSESCNSFIEFSTPSLPSSLESEPRYACDTEQAASIIEKLLTQTNLIHPFIYNVDHIYPASNLHSNAPTAILYGEIGSSSFASLHTFLKESADDSKIKYILRHYQKKKSKKNVSLSGYGVELAIKSTEYKAQDDTRVKGEESSITSNLKNIENTKPDELEGFVFSTLKQLHKDKLDKLDEFQNHLLEGTKEIANFKVWELQELSLQAGQRILNSPQEDQLRVLRDIAQNFPTYAKALVNIAVNNDFRKEVLKNQNIFFQNLNLGSSDAALFINGMYFDMDAIDVFTLLDSLKQEIRLFEGLYKVVGKNPKKISKLVRLDISEDKQDYQIDIRDSAVIYVNDIETDKMYRSWPSSLQDLLRPTYPGMLRNVRRNMYHLVLIVDPSKKESFEIMKLAESFYVHKAPLRVGFVFAVNRNLSETGLNDAGIALLNAFNFISQQKTSYDGLSFLTDVIANMASETGFRDVKPKDVTSLFKTKYPRENLDLIFGSDSDYDTGRRLAIEFLEKTGLSNPPLALLNGVVLKETSLNSDLFEEAVLTEIMRQTPTIQKGVYKGDLTDSNNVIDWMMSQKSVMPRLNKLILGGDPHVTFRYLDLTGTSHPKVKSVDEYLALKQNDLTATLFDKIKFLNTDDEKCIPVSVLIAANLELKDGQKVLSNALHHFQTNSINMRLAIIYNDAGSIAYIIEAAMKSIKKQSALVSFLLNVLEEKNTLKISENPEKAAEFLHADYADSFKTAFNDLQKKHRIFELHKTFITTVLNLQSDGIAVIINGKIIQVPVDKLFIEEDFNLIEKYTMITYGEKFLDELTIDDKKSPKKCSNLIMSISNLLMAHPQSKTRHDIKYHSDKNSAIVIPPLNPDEPVLDIAAVLDPASRGAQKLSSILLTLQKIINCNIKVFLNCVDKHSEMPLKSFFRYVIDSEPNFGDATDDEYPISTAYFSSIPTSPLFTLAMVTPDNWMVEAVRSPYDLDNIHLEEVEGGGVWADFELEYLLLEGHCFEQSSGNPPRGLQITLGTNSTPVLVDTIVMANLGYFQLKANPGAWILNLRQGRSSEIYAIASHDGTDTPNHSSDIHILISNFRSHIVKIRVNKKAGKQSEELLSDGDDDDYELNSIWGSFGSWTGTTSKKTQTNDSVEEDNKLNIFSLASGHLYERLLRIMMLSVLKNTETPVKFWFLKNYLSPTFKDFLPTMAKHYGFEYELVHYKWPRWLHQQTEKQRIIWGYKILFLDVLFPLDVKKFIFVDADQTVRADLKELRDLDLEGAPYGYTPFCESREDMDGFRFWKSGYWASHLHGRKYHISALYVVDLQKFRRIAAGDRLRGQYQGLSQDPNSLSNLDQDLPNNMIHQVAIKSLPQEWLWCETWCDEESKGKAKTIDLCNNPKTKEPKLTAARRIVPEWVGYDNEIKKLMEIFDNEKKSDKINLKEDTSPHSNDPKHLHDTHTEL